MYRSVPTWREPRNSAINANTNNLKPLRYHTLNHILLRCKVTTKTWLLSPLRVDVTRLDLTSFKILLWNYLEDGQTEATELLCYTAWSIWWGRNKAIFDNTQFSHMTIVGKAQSLWMEATATRSSKTVKKNTQDHTNWHPPPKGTAKLNTDVAVLPGGHIGMGFILRDDLGRVLRAGSKRITAAGSSTILEGLALRHALHVLKEHSWPPIQVESDSKELIDTLNGDAEMETYGDIVSADIHALGESLRLTGFRHIRRSGNIAAHNIARNPEFMCFSDFPAKLMKLISNDVT